MNKDGKGNFYRKLKLDKEARGAIKFLRNLKRNLLADCYKQKGNK